MKSKRAAERVMENCVEFLESRKMKLKVNREKSSVSSPTKLKFLGFRLYTLSNGTKGVSVHPKSLKMSEILTGSPYLYIPNLPARK